MNTMPHYRPSKRPSVKSVKEWDTIYTEDMENDWRGLYGGSVIVQLGFPFPDFYRVITNMGKPNVKTSKLFYGESAHNQVEMYVYDLGFRNLSGRI